MCQYEKCTDEELLTRLRSGEEEISDYLMEKYTGFVRQKARAMFLIGGETDDLIQEGMIGLFKAAQSYQPDKDASFRTFAGMCIDRQLYSAIQNSNRQKHMPLNLVKNRRKRMSWKVPGGKILKISSLTRKARGALNRRSTGH